MTLIRALAELLQRDELTPDQRATTDDLVAVSDEASALIDDLLTLARLSEDGDAPAAPAATDLARAAGLACDRMGIRLGDHDSEVERHLEPAPALLSESEALRVVRVLIENVVAHTPPGTRLVVATSVDRHAARLLVEDDGPGVPAAELERIFERFTQLDAARTPGAGEAQASDSPSYGPSLSDGAATQPPAVRRSAACASR